MITENMQLTSYRDAAIWAQQLALETAAMERNVANYIWGNKPAIGCTYGEFRSANPDFCDDAKFWKIAEGTI